MTTAKKTPTKLGSVAGDLTKLRQHFTASHPNLIAHPARPMSGTALFDLKSQSGKCRFVGSATMRPKAKAPVIETTLRLAVYSPTVSGVSLCPNSGAGRGVSMAQREGCGLGAMVRKAIDVTNLTVSTPSPPDAYETVSSGFSVRLGTETMKSTSTGQTAPTNTPDHHQAALVLRAQNHLALALFELRNSTGDTPTRRAMGLAYAAARSLSQVVGGAHHV